MQEIVSLYDGEDKIRKDLLPKVEALEQKTRAIANMWIDFALKNNLHMRDIQQYFADSMSLEFESAYLKRIQDRRKDCGVAKWKE